jgi:predicted DNA-binding transcriptional regulator AlpA
VREVARRTGLSRTTLWRLERRGAFPARRQISLGAIGWIEAEVEHWISGRVPKKGGSDR